jgi:RimJ/RimL family protein N-acetyltransferase
MKLTAPDPPLSAGGLALTPLTDADTHEIAKVCDFNGFLLIDAALEVDWPRMGKCQKLRQWALLRSAQWSVDVERPVADVQALFGIREQSGERQLAGFVGFGLQVGSGYQPLVPDSVNVSYWTRKERRGKDIAPRAVVLALPWAFSAFGVNQAFINATSNMSQRVAEKAGFTRMHGGIDSWWLYTEPDRDRQTHRSK